MTEATCIFSTLSNAISNGVWPVDSETWEHAYLCGQVLVTHNSLVHHRSIYMWLINTNTRELHEFIVDERPTKYAILSHCWTGDEISHARYQERREGYCHDQYSANKIHNCCTLAKSQGIDWIWIDTCCIDKSSSAELSEAINSMYSWYEEAEVCYVFLPDYSHAKEGVRGCEGCKSAPQKKQVSSDWDAISCSRKIASNLELPQSVWFKRGWTLQELLAPRQVLFYDRSGVLFGCKTCMASELSKITRIGLEYLSKDKPLSDASIACRMNWAPERLTSRIEDLAYCLVGIFNVNMPLLYGEGSKAFTRLQHHIIQQIDDDSIFAWRSSSRDGRRGLFAEHPRDFSNSQSIVPVRRRSHAHQLTGRGLEFFAPADLCTTILESSFVGQYIMRELHWTTKVRLACRDMSSVEDSITIKIEKEWVAVPEDVRPLYYRIDAHEHFYTRYSTLHTIIISALGRRGVYVAPTKNFKGAVYRYRMSQIPLFERALFGLLSVFLAVGSSKLVSESMAMTWAILTFGFLLAPWKLSYAATILFLHWNHLRTLLGNIDT